MVYETRQLIDKTLRRRECLSCKTRFRTFEVTDELVGAVKKQKKPAVAKPIVKPKEMPTKRQLAVQPKRSERRKPNEDLEVYYGDAVDLSDLGLDVGRGWNDEY
jgi:hypothetical protein